MPKNKGKGGKSRTRGKNEADDEKRELVLKKDGQEYAQVFQRVNNDYCEAMFVESRFGLLDGTKYLCHIRGKRLKKVRIAIGDIILVGLHDFQDDKPYVILKYTADEIRLLQAYGELPNHRGCNCGGYKDADDDADIEFEDVGMDKI